MSASKSDSKNYSTTVSQDQRMAVGGNGNIIGLTGASVGGNVDVKVTDDGAVQAALDAVQNVTGSTIGAVQNLANSSNQIASQVADSQRAFVETASGQKTWIYGAAIFGAIVLLPKLMKRR